MHISDACAATEPGQLEQVAQPIMETHAPSAIQVTPSSTVHAYQADHQAEVAADHARRCSNAGTKPSRKTGRTPTQTFTTRDVKLLPEAAISMIAGVQMEQPFATHTHAGGPITSTRRPVACIPIFARKVADVVKSQTGVVLVKTTLDDAIAGTDESFLFASCLQVQQGSYVSQGCSRCFFVSSETGMS